MDGKDKEKPAMHGAEELHRCEINKATTTYNACVMALCKELIEKNGEIVRYVGTVGVPDTQDMRKHAAYAWTRFLDRALQLREDFRFALNEADQNLRKARLARTIEPAVKNA
jgi:hypothetical protein